MHQVDMMWWNAGRDIAATHENISAFDLFPDFDALTAGLICFFGSALDDDSRLNIAAQNLIGKNFCGLEQVHFMTKTQDTRVSPRKLGQGGQVFILVSADMIINMFDPLIKNILVKNFQQILMNSL